MLFQCEVVVDMSMNDLLISFDERRDRCTNSGQTIAARSIQLASRDACMMCVYDDVARRKNPSFRVLCITEAANVGVLCVLNLLGYNLRQKIG